MSTTETSHVVSRAVRPTHHVRHALGAYSDQFNATPPAEALASPETLQAWADAEVVRRRGDHGWTVAITAYPRRA